MGIEIGDYVRTKKGYIAKVISNFPYIQLDRTVDFKQDSGNFYSGLDLLDDDKLNAILKHSKNIIDLIEKGDYVNGKKVIDKLINKINGNKLIVVGDLDYKCKTVLEYAETDRISILGNDDIKSIVTKELMKSIEYRMENN